MLHGQLSVQQELAAVVKQCKHTAACDCACRRQPGGGGAARSCLAAAPAAGALRHPHTGSGAANVTPGHFLTSCRDICWIVYVYERCSPGSGAGSGSGAVGGKERRGDCVRRSHKHVSNTIYRTGVAADAAQAEAAANAG